MVLSIGQVELSCHHYGQADKIASNGKIDLHQLLHIIKTVCHSFILLAENIILMSFILIPLTSYDMEVSRQS